MLFSVIFLKVNWVRELVADTAGVKKSLETKPMAMRFLLRTLMGEIIQFDILQQLHSVCMLILQLWLCRVNPHRNWGHVWS